MGVDVIGPKRLKETRGRKRRLGSVNRGSGGGEGQRGGDGETM